MKRSSEDGLLPFPVEKAAKQPTLVGKGGKPIIRVLHDTVQTSNERGSRSDIGGEVTYAVNRDDRPSTRELTVKNLAEAARRAPGQKIVFEYRKVIPINKKK